MPCTPLPSLTPPSVVQPAQRVYSHLPSALSPFSSPRSAVSRTSPRPLQLSSPRLCIAFLHCGAADLPLSSSSAFLLLCSLCFLPSSALWPSLARFLSPRLPLCCPALLCRFPLSVSTAALPLPLLPSFHLHLHLPSLSPPPQLLLRPFTLHSSAPSRPLRATAQSLPTRLSRPPTPTPLPSTSPPPLLMAAISPPSTAAVGSSPPPPLRAGLLPLRPSPMSRLRGGGGEGGAASSLSHPPHAGGGGTSGLGATGNGALGVLGRSEFSSPPSLHSSVGRLTIRPPPAVMDEEKLKKYKTAMVRPATPLTTLSVCPVTPHPLLCLAAPLPRGQCQRQRTVEGCSFGVHCDFAHSTEELRRSLNVVAYAPVMCQIRGCVDPLCTFSHCMYESQYHPDVSHSISPQHRRSSCPTTSPLSPLSLRGLCWRCPGVQDEDLQPLGQGGWLPARRLLLLCPRQGGAAQQDAQVRRRLCGRPLGAHPPRSPQRRRPQRPRPLRPLPLRQEPRHRRRTRPQSGGRQPPAGGRPRNPRP